MQVYKKVNSTPSDPAILFLGLLWPLINENALSNPAKPETSELGALILDRAN